MSELARLVDRLSPEQRRVLAEQLAERGAGQSDSDHIAIVSMAGRFPGGCETPEELWSLLDQGRDGVVRMPDDRWDLDRLFGADADEYRAALRWGGYLDRLDGFEPGFFGISPNEAAAMDPQQRILLEVCWEALERAGVPGRGLAGSRTGVFVGVAAQDYMFESLSDVDNVDGYAVSGCAHSTLVGRVAYTLGLNGPAIALDTACSSSLVSVHLACESLRSGDSDLALAGGVKVMSSAHMSVVIGRSGMIPPDGRCKTLDARANGYVRSEGCAVVALKRLADARRDGDPVLAVIRGSAINQDGRSNGLTAPSATAQRDLHRAALQRAGVDPATVGLVELHGTGTELGDPIEVEGLRPVYGPGEPGSCALGALKSNVGHMEEASGVSGLIKAVMSVRHGRVPPNLHFEELNPNISLENTRFYVPTEAGDWPQPEGPRRAAVSAFGLGGTNAHVVIEQFTEADRTAPGETGPPYVLPLSSESSQGVRDNARRLADWLGERPEVSVRDVAHTLSRRRSHLGERAVVTAPGREELVDSLRALAQDELPDGVVAARATLPPASESVWVFSGYGSQWPGMGADLLDSEPEFARVVEELTPVVLDLCGFSVHDVLRTAERSENSADPVTIYVVQLALARTWMSYGLRPSAVLGHSMGEVTAAVVAGGLTPEEGARVMVRRTDVLRGLVGKGAMAAVGLPAEDVEPLLAGVEGVSIAVASSPTSSVVTGGAEQVAELVEKWTAEGVFARLVRGADGAGHSHQVDPGLPDLRARLADLAPLQPEVAVYSTAHADPRRVPSFNADYWAMNLRSRVRFADAVRAAVQDGFRVFVEVSPHPVTTTAIEETLRAEGVDHAVVVPTLNRKRPQRESLLTSLATLHVHGVGMDWDRINPTGAVADLPTNAWRRGSYWLADPGAGRGRDSRAHPLLGTHMRLPGTPRTDLWQCTLDPVRTPWLSASTSSGVPVLPVSALAEMGTAAASMALGAAPERVCLKDLRALSPLELDVSATVTTQFRELPEPGEGEIDIITESGTGRTVHATMGVGPADGVLPSEPADGPLPEIAVQELRDRLAEQGQVRGAILDGITSLTARRADAEAEGLARFTVRGPDPATGRRMVLDPVTVEAALHAALGAAPDPARVPTAIGRVRTWDGNRVPVRGWARVTLPEDSATPVAEVVLVDAEDVPVLHADGVALSPVTAVAQPVALRGDLYATTWREASAGERLPAEGEWLIVARDPSSGGALERTLSEAGQRARVLAPEQGSPAGPPTALEGTRPPTGVVILDVSTSGEPGWDAQGLAELTDQFSGLPSVAGDAPRTRLFLVTRGVSEVPGHDPVGALARSLAADGLPGGATHVDLEGGAGTDPGEYHQLVDELLSGPGAETVALRAGSRYVRRLVPATAPETAARSTLARHDGGYVLSGHDGAALDDLARQLADLDAGHLVLHTVHGGAAELAESLRASGTRTRVTAISGDLDVLAAERLVTEHPGARLRGIARLVEPLSGGAADEGSENRDEAAVTEGMLDTARDLALDWFLVQAPVDHVVPGQGRRADALHGAALAALTERAGSQGVPVRVLYTDPRPAEGTGDRRTRKARTIVVGEGHRALVHLPADLAERAGAWAGEFIERPLSAHDDGGAESWDSAALAGVPAEDLPEVVSGRLRRIASRVLGFTGDELDADRPLIHLGLDSLMAVRLKRTVEEDFAFDLPVALIMGGLTTRELERRLVDRWRGADGEGTADEPPAVLERARARAASRTRRNRLQTKRRDGRE